MALNTNVDTNVNKPDDKRERIKAMREYQQSLLDAIGESDAYFIPKMAYRPIGKSEICISFFPNELARGVDIYTEFSSRDYIPEDPQRRLFKLRYNAHFEEEYDKTDPDSISGQFRYLVPVSELIVITPKVIEKVIEKVKEKSVEFDLMDPDTDAPLDQLTVRDLAAILLKKPVSSKQWLNKLITDY